MWWNKPPASAPLGLVAGTGDFPLLFAESAARQGKKLIVFGIRGYTDPKVCDLAMESCFVSLGGLGELVAHLRKTKIKHLVLAGGIPKKEIYNPSFRPDAAAADLIRQTSEKGDDRFLKALEIFLRIKHGIRIVDSRIFMKDVLAVKGLMTRRAPTQEEWADLRFGIKIARGIGRMDIGQTVVVKRGIVLAVEAIEGTDEAIRRGAGLGQGEVVVVKIAKPNQDLRFDLPCVGQKTLDTMRSVSSRVLAIEAGKTVMIFKEKLIAGADRDEMTVVGI